MTEPRRETIRGRGRGSWRRSRKSRADAEPSAPAVGPLLSTITREDLDSNITSSSGKEFSMITDCRLVGSYNWLNRKSPTILVPGAPPEWTPTGTSERLPQDKGTYFRDQNSARYAAHVFQPAANSILNQDPDFDFTQIDIVACNKPDKQFRFIVEAVGSTVFFVRRENSPTQALSNVVGFGHTFPEANTTWGSDVKGSESHQRILQYRFAGLSCLVRYGGDGYLPQLYQPHGPRREPAATAPDDLLASFNQVSVSTVSPEGEQALRVESGGELVPQSAMFDLKTRSATKQYSNILRDELPRLWISQIPNFVVGFHTDGEFHDVRVEDVREEVRKWEERNEVQLRKLSTLMKLLIEFADGQPNRRFEVVYNGTDGNGELELREVGDEVNCCLSDVMKRRWAAGYLDGRGKEKKDEREEVDDAGQSKHIEREDSEWSGESESEKDFTACSASTCGYCGHCAY
ncbi:hypothetical protein AN7245.2 [Aspergillus nidulans FGSC A4]|nr:hypothetical protein AN7245.2 [Aspergillus nidulans FGSC A4]|eukprot:XP_680514.1 hypothetical protein AN7245.2 [Aspergillus nidulans FGSC A4]